MNSSIDGRVGVAYLICSGMQISPINSGEDQEKFPVGYFPSIWPINVEDVDLATQTLPIK